MLTLIFSAYDLIKKFMTINFKIIMEELSERKVIREKAENKKRPDIDKFYVTCSSLVCVKISYLGSLILSLKKINSPLSFSLSS